MTRDLLVGLALLTGAYLAGGIPFALIVGKTFYHVDLRERGSGNLGATNTFRELGPVAGVAVLLLDAAKGAAAVALAGLALSASGTSAVLDPTWFLLLVTCAVMAGHTFSPYLRLRGGKGVAAAAGGLFVLMWPVALTALLVFAAMVALFRMVSLASVTIAVLFPALVWALYSREPAVLALAVLAAALVIWRHRANISRIIRGEEPRITDSRRREGTR